MSPALRRAAVVLAAALAAAGASGCAALQEPRGDGAPAPAEESGGFGGWLARRGRNLAAIFGGSVSLGPGFGARAALTERMQAGALFLGGSGRSHFLPEETVVAGKVGEHVGAWKVRDEEYGLSPWYVCSAQTARIDAADRKWQGDLARTRSTAFSLQVHAALIGVELSFDPAPIGLFFAGFFGYEPPPEP